MEAPNIDSWNRKVLNALNDLGAQLDAFRRRLDCTLVLARFHSQVVEMSCWIEQKTKSLRSSQNHLHDKLTLEDKMAHLKKHQALEIELTANAPRIQLLCEQLAEFRQDSGILRDSDQRSEVIQRGEAMVVQWEELNQTTRLLNAALKEAKDLFDFDVAAQRILKWIRDRQFVLQAQEMGKDFEHCRQLLDNLSGKDADQSVDGTTIGEVNALGAKLTRSGSDSQEEIEAKLELINSA